MRNRFLLTGTLAAGLAMFVWSILSHAAIPSPLTQPKHFGDPAPVIQAIQAQGSGNGIYVAGQGLFAAVSLAPGLADRSTQMATPLIEHLVLDLVLALGLALFLWMTPVRTPGGAAELFALLGLLAGVQAYVPYWIWYGFGASYSVAGIADCVISWTLAGLVLGALVRRATRGAGGAEGVAAGAGAPGLGVDARSAGVRG